MLEIRDLRFSYPDGTEVIKGISLTAAKGERLAILGRNGSGKTTLARLMCGLLVPAEGEVLADGLSSSDPSSVYELRRRVGIVFQDPDDQIVEATVEREVGFGLRNLGLEPEAVAERVREAMEVFEIDHLRRRPCHLLSAGEKQTITVASIFAMQPDYIILDESTSLLDAQARRRLLAALERLLGQTGAGLVFISMRLEDVWFCDRVASIENGVIGFDGGKGDLIGYLQEMGFPLHGIAELVSEIARRIPAVTESLSASAILDGAVLADTLVRVKEGH